MLSKKLMTNSLKALTWFLFVLYLLVLVNVIVLKEGSAISMARYRSEMLLSQRISGINFVPLKTVIPYLKGEPSVRIAMENLLGNIFAFSPLGFLLPLLLKKFDSLKSIFWISFSISLLIEILQLVYYLGSSDIDDIILNILGSLLGFGVYFLFKNFYKRKVGVIS
jgi:glycopeptide antibiotics resistance protein